MSVDDIFRAHERGELDFEDARDELHALDPSAMAEVLEVLRDPSRTDSHPVAVMTLADVGYPPAFEHMRTLLDPEDDPEQLGIPAAVALDTLAGGRFDAERLYRDWSGMAETFAAIAAWWDSGAADVPPLNGWLAKRRARAAALRNSKPPPQPKASAAEHEALRPRLVAMVQHYRALPSTDQHQLDYAALRRVMHIYTAWASADEGLSRALECVGRYLAGQASAAELEQAAELAREATSSANAAADWNAHHNAYMNPAAKAAACVAQGVLYATSPEARNRQQGLNYARDAVEWSGGGLRAELAWQEQQVSNRSSGAPATGDGEANGSKHEMGLFGLIGLLVGLGGLAMSALSVVNTIFELGIEIGARGGATTPLPSDWAAVGGLAGASVLIIGLSVFGSKVANMVRDAKGKPMLRIGIIVGALGLLAIVGRGLQVVALVSTYGSMLAYYCTDVGSLEDVEGELEDGPSTEDLDRCIGRTAQWGRHDLLPTLVAAGANFEDQSSEPEFRSCVLGYRLSLDYITTAIELGASPSTCPNSEALVQDKVYGVRPDEDEATAKIVQALLDAGWSAEAKEEGRDESALELARENQLPATIAVLEAAGS